MSVEKERPWKLGIPSQEGRYEVTVEDPMDGNRQVSIAFCTRGGRLLGPSPSMKVVAWREVAEPYRASKARERYLPESYKEMHETRFYVNGKECFTDQQAISGADVITHIGGKLGLAPTDRFVTLHDNHGVYLKSGLDLSHPFPVYPNMEVVIDSIPF